MIHPSDEVLRAAYNRYDAGERVESVAHSLGVSTNYLRERWKLRGIWTGFRVIRPARPRKLTDDQARESYRLYQKGQRTAAESAAELGVRADTLRDRWRKLGLKADQKHAHRFSGDSMFQGFKKINKGHACVTLDGRCLICTDHY